MPWQSFSGVGWSDSTVMVSILFSRYLHRVLFSKTKYMVLVNVPTMSGPPQKNLLTTKARIDLLL